MQQRWMQSDRSQAAHGARRGGDAAGCAGGQEADSAHAQTHVLLREGIAKIRSVFAYPA